MRGDGERCRRRIDARCHRDGLESSVLQWRRRWSCNRDSIRRNGSVHLRMVARRRQHRDCFCIACRHLHRDSLRCSRLHGDRDCNDHPASSVERGRIGVDDVVGHRMRRSGCRDSRRRHCTLHGGMVERSAIDHDQRSLRRHLHGNGARRERLQRNIHRDRHRTISRRSDARSVRPFIAGCASRDRRRKPHSDLIKLVLRHESVSYATGHVAQTSSI